MKRILLVLVLLLTASTAGAAPYPFNPWPDTQGGGGGTADLGTLTDTGNLCAANEAVVRNATDTGFECAAAGTGTITQVGTTCVAGACFEGVGVEDRLSGIENIEILLDADASAPSAEFRVLNNAGTRVFYVNEGGGVITTLGFYGEFFLSNGSGVNIGELRLGKDESICWNADGLGDIDCLELDSALLQVTARAGNPITIDEKIVGDPSLGFFCSNGTYMCLDTDADGVCCETGEPNLTQNAPTATSGNETIAGDLTVTGDLAVTGVTNPLEMVIAQVGIDKDDLPTINDCYPLSGGIHMLPTAGGATPAATTGCPYQTGFDYHVTRMCAYAFLAATPTNNCIFDLWSTSSTRATPMGSINISAAAGGGDIDAVGESFCVTVNDDVLDTDYLYLQANATAANCDVGNSIFPTIFKVYGYGRNIP